MTNIEKIRQEIERLKNIAENNNASEYLRGQARICRIILSFIDSLPEEKPSDDLEEAADEYADKHGFRVPYDGSNNYYDDVDVKASKEGFIAGAEWMRKKDVEDMYMSDNRHFLKCYEQGKVDMKVEMMKDAMDGEIVKDINNMLAVTAKNINLDGFKFGDKVKIIIVKQ